jgi:hypothetical protein
MDTQNTNNRLVGLSDKPTVQLCILVKNSVEDRLSCSKAVCLGPEYYEIQPSGLGSVGFWIRGPASITLIFCQFSPVPPA